MKSSAWSFQLLRRFTLTFLQTVYALLFWKNVMDWVFQTFQIIKCNYLRNFLNVNIMNYYSTIIWKSKIIILVKSTERKRILSL